MPMALVITVGLRRSVGGAVPDLGTSVGQPVGFPLSEPRVALIDCGLPLRVTVSVT